MTDKTLIDFPQLVYEIRHMTPRRKLWKVLRTELKRLHHWKDLPRGKTHT